MSEHLISRDAAENDLFACAAYLAESIKSSDGHAEAMLAVIPRYLSKGEVDLAAEFANTVDDPFMRDKLLILVAEKCAGIDDDEYAGQLIDAIEDFGLQTEGRERIGLIKAAKGQFEAARRIASSMPHPDYVDAGIALKQAADGDDEAARDTIAGIDFVSARVSAYLSIAHAKLNSDETESAVQYLEQAPAPAAEIEHEEERIRSFVEIGNLFIAAKQNGRAIETFDTARGYAEELDNIHRDAFFAAVSTGFLRAGSQDLSDRALDLVADKTQIASCLLAHARHYWNNDLKDDAVESLEEAYAILRSQRDIETRNSKERFGLFSSIAAQFAGFEKGMRAIEIAEGIEDENERMSSLSQIAAILTLRKEDDLARNALNAIGEDAQRVFALIGMSDAKARNGEMESAIALLDEAVHLTETVPQLASRSSAYNEIAKRLYELGETDKARSTAHTNLETIASIRDQSSRAVSLVLLSEFAEASGLAIDESQVETIRRMIAA
jgi:tetratricopeptide (TPR) repeat protein